jgi:hypothetical protein
MGKKPTWPLQQLVEVEWDDSITDSSWASASDHRMATVGPHRSLGYLVRSDRVLIQVAQSMSAVTQHITDSLSIPRAAVRKIRSLGKVR